MKLSEINDVLDEARYKLAKGEKLHTVDGKKGVWRTIKGNHIFFPRKGGKPIGMPRAMRKATGGWIKKAAKKVLGSIKRIAKRRKT